MKVTGTKIESGRYRLTFEVDDAEVLEFSGIVHLSEIDSIHQQTVNRLRVLARIGEAITDALTDSRVS